MSPKTCRLKHKTALCLLSSVLCLSLTAHADQWILDGEKELPVASQSGTANNLTVVDLLTLAGTPGTTLALISGADAGPYAGTYLYAGTDDYHGHVFTNSAGKYLYWDVGYAWYGSWLLGDSVNASVVAFCFDGSGWYDASFNNVDLLLTGSPEYRLINGNLDANGWISANKSLYLRDGTGNFYSFDDDGAVIGYSSEGVISNTSGCLASMVLQSTATMTDTIITGERGKVYSSFATLNAYQNGQITTYDIGGCFYSASAGYDGYISNNYLMARSAVLATTFQEKINMGKKHHRLEGCFLNVSAEGAGHPVSMHGDIWHSILNTVSHNGGPLLVTNGLVSSMLAVDGGTYGGQFLLGVGKNNIQTNPYTSVIGSGITTFISNATYSGSVVAGYGNGQCTTNNRYYFGSNSWLFVSGTNLMFRNTAGSIGTINITY